MQTAGIPNGVYNVVHGFGPGSAGESLTQHPEVDAVTFTGESQTGAAIMKTVAASVKPVSFELGGKNAAIVFEDCEFEDAVSGIGQAVFLNTGQVCLCAERIYVQRAIFDRFVDALKNKAEALRLGSPLQQSTEMGPLISKQHREKVLSYYELACDEGANVVTGGGVPQFGNSLDGGFYVQPTIYTGLAESARCVKEEIFGPVCHVAPFDEEEEAIHMANDTKYGLAASIWTSNLKRGHRVAQHLRTPFGGVGLSGIGREGGIHSLNFYSELNNICIKL
jgi:aminomuconate-semialdehyde/2-hydroxymuconate-6-semialdehyde dehydrogenase